MLNLCNDAGCIEELFGRKKRIVLYGAGSAAKVIISSYYDKGLKQCLQFIVDANEDLDGTYCEVSDSIKVKIISLRHFCEAYKDEMQQFDLLITQYYSFSVIKPLDEIQELNGVRVYIFPVLLEKVQPAAFSIAGKYDKPLIPKIIHYFWIGELTMPKEYQHNIETWRKYCPDYEIIEWNESNYDFGRFKYSREALECKQYMYATDQARKDVLYRYGGIYFDTDVEIFKPIDDLLYNEAFIGIDDGGELNSGSGLGAAKNNRVIGEMLESYQNQAFVNEDGSINGQYNTFYETRHMISKGYVVKNEYQNIDGMACLPREVFMPKSVIGLEDNYTENTLANHNIAKTSSSNQTDYIKSVLERIYKN